MTQGQRLFAVDVDVDRIERGMRIPLELSPQTSIMRVDAHPHDARLRLWLTHPVGDEEQAPVPRVLHTMRLDELLLFPDAPPCTIEAPNLRFVCTFTARRVGRDETYAIFQEE